MVKRIAKYPIDPLFINRWSPRAMSGAPITDAQLMSLFEAARWAPSSYNNQPWRFIYAKRDTVHWDKLFKLLVSTNQIWAQRAAALVLIVSHNNFEHNNKPARTHSFDTGAAMENFALQGSISGLVVHGMEGFDYDRARKEFAIPADYTIEAMFAVGMRADKSVLPEFLQEREEPSDRKPLNAIVFEGTFKGA